MTRRSFVATSAAAASIAPALPQTARKIPVGLELYSVRDELAKDLMATVRAVGKMGYEVVEFYSPYYQWTTEYATEVRKLLDDIGVKCLSTHNSASSFTPEGIQKAIDLNQILGSKAIVMASPGRIAGLDSWKTVAEKLSWSAEKLSPLGMRAGYHNHAMEFRRVEGQRPMDILAKETPKSVELQFDVGTCVEVGEDPVAWIHANPGRIKSMHCKDWAPGEGKGFKVLFGEGASPWKEVTAAAESTGGIEFYLIEQEGSRFGSMETAMRCLDNWKKFKG